MSRRVCAIWLSLMMILSLAFVIDVVTDFTPLVRGNMLYVNTTGDDGAYTKIQDAINDSFNGYTVFVYSGTYNESIVVDKTINLIGEDRNTTIINGSVSENVIHVMAYWVNITGFTVTTKAPSPSNFGIKLENVQNCTIKDNNIYRNRYYGIDLRYSSLNNIIGNNLSNNDQGIILIYSDNNNITGNTANYNEDGIFISHSNGNKINLNNCSYNEYGIQLFHSEGNNLTDNTMIKDGIYIRGNSMEHYNTHNIDTSNIVNEKPVYYWKNRTMGTVPLGAGQVLLANCSNVRVENQNIDNASVGIGLGFCSNNTIINNNLWNNQISLELHYSIYNNLTGNNASTNVWYGIYLFTSHLNNITGNTASYDDRGIILKYSENNKIIDNSVFSNRLYGIYLDQSNNNNITDNHIFSCNYWGLYVDMSSGEVISGNTMIKEGLYVYGAHFKELWNTHSIDTSNTVNGKPVQYWKNQTGGNIPSGAGQVILANCTNVIIEDQNLTYGTLGISLAFSSNITITRNNVSNNKVGISLKCSSQNRIYHNNIMGNWNSAYEYEGVNNHWDYGYPSGGNYWSDYEGDDNNNGPDQNITGSDGIGDTPYSFEYDSKDYYPLMHPIGNFTYLHHGWNLISIPYLQPDTNLGTVLNSIKGSYDAVEWYNVSNRSDHWKINHTSKPPNLNDLEVIDHTMGFWVRITERLGILFEFPGTEPAENQTITLHPGWNLVGYPSLTKKNITYALNNITFGVEVDSIWTYNAASQNWKLINEQDHFEVGKGYWIHSNVEKTWEVPL